MNTCWEKQQKNVGVERWGWKLETEIFRNRCVFLRLSFTGLMWEARYARRRIGPAGRGA